MRLDGPGGIPSRIATKKEKTASRYADYGQSLLSFGAHAGISAGAGHVETRGACVAAFSEVFGRMPLVAGHAKVVDARTGWFW